MIIESVGKNNKAEITPRIAFSSDDLVSSFIQSDLELLRTHFDVRVVYFGINIRRPKDTLKTLFYMPIGILLADLTFSWFASTHAFWAVRLSKIFRKKSIVVVGGYEVAKVPEIRYGLMLNPRAARRVKFVLNNNNKILAVSKFSKREILNYTNSENVELVYNGINYEKFKPNGDKEGLVITVGSILKGRIKLKGLKIFIESAKFLPEERFIVIGLSKDTINYLKDSAPINVKFVGSLLQEDLIQYYQKAKVYCQLSYRESFGMSLAEAMLCECVPVVTNKAALPEVVGDTGFYVHYGDPKAAAEAIKKALKSNKGKEARKRIKTMFSIEKRNERLVEIIMDILCGEK